jgi:hypothetical protein
MTSSPGHRCRVNRRRLEVAFRKANFGPRADGNFHDMSYAEFLEALSLLAMMAHPSKKYVAFLGLSWAFSLGIFGLFWAFSPSHFVTLTRHLDCRRSFKV